MILHLLRFVVKKVRTLSTIDTIYSPIDEIDRVITAQMEYLWYSTVSSPRRAFHLLYPSNALDQIT